MTPREWNASARARLRLPMLLMFALACGGDGATSSGSAVGSITLTYAKSTLSLGDIQPLGPVFLDGSGAVLSNVTNARWTSSNTSIVTVDQVGHVSGVALGGPVTITVTAGSATAKAVISVIPNQIYFPPGTVTSVPVGNTVQLSATALDISGTPIAASLAPITWTSNNPSVATVGATTGVVSGVGTGMVHITATAAGQSSGVDLEVGVSSPYDGRWTGFTLTTGRPLTIIVLFGSVRSFVLTVYLFTAPYSTSCTFSVIAYNSAYATIASGQFTLPLSVPPTATVTGTFTDPNTLTGNHSAIPLGTYTCSTLTNGDPTTPNTMNANLAASAFSATKQ